MITIVGSFIMGANVHHWGKKDEKSQILAKGHYRKFYENFELLLEKAHPNTLKNIQKSDKEIINLIEQNNAPHSTELGKTQFKNKIKTFNDYLSLLNTGKKKNIIESPTQIL